MPSPDRFEKRERRLKSLDEFEPLPWHRKRRRAVGAAALMALAIAVGGSIGWLLAG